MDSEQWGGAGGRPPPGFLFVEGFLLVLSVRGVGSVGSDRARRAWGSAPLVAATENPHSNQSRAVPTLPLAPVPGGGTISFPPPRWTAPLRV